VSVISDGFGEVGRLQAPVFQFRRRGEAGQPWRVRAVELEEQLAGRFSAVIDLDSEDPTADPAALLSASGALELRRPGPGGSQRRFCGVVRAVTEPHGLAWGERRRCQITLEPAFFCLEEEVLARPFVGLTVPQILREVLAEALGRFEGRELELRLQRPSDDAGSARAYAPRELCVQYGESTHDFCRRLMAEEGLSYFFDHRGEVEKLVIVDEAQFEPAGPALPLLAASGMTERQESLSDLTRNTRRGGGGVLLKPFDHLDPQARWDDSASGAPARPGHGGVYDPRPGVVLHGYAQGAYQRSDLVPRTEIRRQQLAVDDECLRGSGTVVGLTAGHFVFLGDDPLLSPWARGEHLVTEVVHTAVVPEAFAAGEQAPQEHRITFTLLPRRIAFRPAPRPKPTALEDWGLVLSAFERDPIDTDRHGRVRVQFLYDRREEAAVERRSPWIPVSQPWAGSGYGVQVIPRAGMLARLEYIFGDPDRPVVAECFPTGTNRLPAPLPEQKSRLTLRSKSLRDGGRDSLHFNEIALDDAAQKEEVFLRAGHDLRRKVLHDDRTETLHDEVHLVGGDQALKVIGKRSKTVDASEAVTVMRNRTTVVEADDARAVKKAEAGGKDQDTVDGPAVSQVKWTRTSTVVGLERGTFQGGREEAVKGLDTTHVSGLHREQADVQWKAAQGEAAVVLEEGNALVGVGGSLTTSTDRAVLTLTPEEQGSFTVKALKIVCGSAQLVMEAGALKLKAPTILVRGAPGGAVQLNAGGVTTTGKDISSSAVVLNEVKGGLVVFSDTPGVVAPLGPSKVDVQVAGQVAEQLRLAPAEEETLHLEATLLGIDLKPAINAAYKLLLPTGELFQGKTDGSGKLTQTLPGAARTADVTFEPADGSGPISRTLALVGDDAPEAPISHLRQLGYGGDTSPPDEVIREFQGTSRLAETGTMDAPTKEALAALRAGRGPRNS
jgi:type VI secretion system secreted protein VgrG